jgi:tripartite-type tricarboxylate transporter receptor subunit TctC
VLVDNKPGAAGRLAIDDVRRGAADGSTILVTPASTLTMYPHIYRNLTYDPMTDLAPVSMLATFGFVLVVGSRVPPSVRGFADYVSWCRANPKLADCGNAGAGSFPHFMAVLLARDARVELTHVPFKSSSAALQDLAGGQISAVLSTEPSALPLIQAGRLRALATSWEQRSPFLPDVPTLKELGLPRLTQREWFGAFVSRGTPAATIATANEELALAVGAPGTREAWATAAIVPQRSTASELGAVLRSEYDFWGPIIKASGFTPDT